jgi:hypothetical protein
MSDQKRRFPRSLVPLPAYVARLNAKETPRTNVKQRKAVGRALAEARRIARERRDGRNPGELGVSMEDAE